MDHFYTQQKRQTPINYQTPKKKTQQKLARKKNKTERQMERECKKKRMKLPARIVLHIADTTPIYTWDKWVLSAILIILPTWSFRMANNIACCCASMGTRILLTSLVDLVTGCVRTKWLTWHHCEAKKDKKKGEENRFVSYFVPRFFLPFFFSKKKTKQTGCIIMYLHSASRVSDKFTLDVCISKCVCMRACVSCTHVRALIHVFDHCRCMCTPVSMYPQICGMDVSNLACMMRVYMRVSVFQTYAWD